MGSPQKVALKLLHDASAALRGAHFLAVLQVLSGRCAPGTLHMRLLATS
jgi:hypothetical protein